MSVFMAFMPSSGGGFVAQPEEQQAPWLVTGPDRHRGDVAGLAGRVAGGEHVRGGPAEIGVESRRLRSLDRDHDVLAVVGPAGHRGKVNSQRTASGRGDRGQPDINRQGSTSGGLQGSRELCRLVGRQLDHEAAAAFERYAHYDAAAFLRDLERAVTRPRLHRRHPASPFVPGAA
jgi:hypothetical protein